MLLRISKTKTNKAGKIKVEIDKGRDRKEKQVELRKKRKGSRKQEIIFLYDTVKKRKGTNR